MKVERNIQRVGGILLAITVACVGLSDGKANAFLVSRPNLSELAKRSDVIAKVRVDEVALVGEGQSTISDDPAVKSLFYSARESPI